MYERWTELELILLEKLFPVVSNDNLSILFDRSVKSIINKAYKKNLTKDKDKFTRNQSEVAKKIIQKRKMEDCFLKGYRGKYKKVRMPNHPRADEKGYVYKHIIIMETILGRKLKDNEVVIHKDKNKSNNSPDNLKIQIFWSVNFRNLELEKEVLKLRKQNIPIRKIGKILNVSFNTVRKISDIYSLKHLALDIKNL